MTQTVCDICGKVIQGGRCKRVKIKTEEYLFGEAYWKKLDTHYECWANIAKEVRNNARNEN